MLFTHHLILKCVILYMTWQEYVCYGLHIFLQIICQSGGRSCGISQWWNFVSDAQVIQAWNLHWFLFSWKLYDFSRTFYVDERYCDIPWNTNLILWFVFFLSRWQDVEVQSVQYRTAHITTETWYTHPHPSRGTLCFQPHSWFHLHQKGTVSP
jgi:hypothetical protein